MVRAVPATSVSCQMRSVKALALTVGQCAQGGFEPRQGLAALGPAIRTGRRIAGQVVERIGVVTVGRSQIDEVAAVPPAPAATVLDAVPQDAMEQRRRVRRIAVAVAAGQTQHGVLDDVEGVGAAADGDFRHPQRAPFDRVALAMLGGTLPGMLSPAALIRAMTFPMMVSWRASSRPDGCSAVSRLGDRHLSGQPGPAPVRGGPLQQRGRRRAAQVRRRR